MKISRLLIVMPFLILNQKVNSWGFYAHKELNYYSCFLLPYEMFGFYKENIDLIREFAVKADQRRYAVDGEAPKHYIDLDHYEKSLPLDTMPRKWNDAVAKYSEDTLLAYGIVPWNVVTVLNRLSKAMERKDYERIIKYSADLGHYIGDAHVPLHATKNYNGQLTDQKGIHGLWESRIPELFATNFDYFIGKAKYINNPLNFIWDRVEESFGAKDSVLRLEKVISERFPNTKYSYEIRGRSTVRVYSKEFTDAYHQSMNGMVERRLRKSIFAVASFWYTAWVNAGQPDLEFDLNIKKRLKQELADDPCEDGECNHTQPPKGRLEPK
jgi:hypothetical protein